MELGWIDYSKEARQRTLAVLAALQESTAIDRCLGNESGAQSLKAYSSAFSPRFPSRP